MATTIRKTQAERREEILDAALDEFAEHGYHGGSTEGIARRAGISQPYVFRLFGTKQELFKAVVTRCFRETLELFQRAAEGKRGREALGAMGDAYVAQLTADRTRLKLQMQAYAASDEAEIADVVRHGLGGLEWTVNAYTLTFAVLLLSGAALGDRFGRRRMLAIGLGIFTVASAAAALAPTIGALDAARAFQGLGGAIVLPLTLTILSASVPPERRGVAIGAWGGVSGPAVAFGPVGGGARLGGFSWRRGLWPDLPVRVGLLPLL